MHDREGRAGDGGDVTRAFFVPAAGKDHVVYFGMVPAEAAAKREDGFVNGRRVFGEVVQPKVGRGTC